MQPSKTVTRLRAMRDATGRTGDCEDGESPPEAGFTLIELMVVLLIMGILLAIAIPTFLGVTNSAHAAAAKTNLTSAMTEARASYVSNDDYTATPTEVKLLAAETKTLTFTAGTSTSTTNVSVGVTDTSYLGSPGRSIRMAVYQKSTNVCWMEQIGTRVSLPGTWYSAFKVTATEKCDSADPHPATIPWSPNTFPKPSAL